jgi:phospholipase C
VVSGAERRDENSGLDHPGRGRAPLLKFIERNWGLTPLSAASRDNLLSPVMSEADPYVPQNRPAIRDLMGLFQF